MTHGHSHIQRYLKVFGALLLLTVITVGVAQFHLGIAAAIFVALLIAASKGSLVAAYFMHLIGENKTVFIVLIMTAFFLVVLLAAPTLVHMDDYHITPP